MADIRKELNQIKNAVYGREVRSSIHDGIKKINDEVENATDLSESAKHQVENIQQQVNQLVVEGDSSVEAAQARVDAEGKSFPTLKARLDEKETQFSSQLAQADKFRRYESMVSRKKTKRPTITIVDDDGYREVYTILFKLAKEFNIPFTSSIITGKPMGFPHDDRPEDTKYYNYEMVMEMRDSGLVQFIGHSHNNINYRESTEEEIRYDIEQMVAFLKRYGLDHRAMAFPFGEYDDRVLEIAKDYFDYTTGSASTVDEGKRIVKNPVNNYRLGRLSGDGNRDFSTIEAGMDEAIEANGGLVLTTHTGQYPETNEAHLRRIITTALDKGLEFVTLEDCWRIHGNVAQFGGTHMNPAHVFGSDGTITSEQLGRTIIRRDTEVTADTPLDYFAPNTVTRLRVSVNKGFPVRDSGFVDVYRYTDHELWSYQVFTTTRDKKIFVRTWDEENRQWNNFENHTPQVYLGINAIKLDDPPTAPHLRDRVVRTNINNRGNEGFPENKSGVLIHYGQSADLDGFITQKYEIYEEAKTYVRWWIASSNRWSKFRLVNPVHHLPINSITADMLPSDFDVGITMSHTQRANAEGFPNNRGGTITVYRPESNEDGWTYQEIMSYGNYEKYIRYEKPDGTWSKFRKFLTEEVD